MSENQVLEDIDLFGEDADDQSDEGNIDEFEQGEDAEFDEHEVLGDEQDASPEGSDITNITQLAEEFGVEPSVLYDLQVPMGDGVDAVSLSVLKDSYQDSQRGRDALVQDQQAFEQEKQNHQANLATQSTQNADLDKRVMGAEAELRQINDAYNGLNWELFERENPAEAVLQKQKFQEAFNQALNRKDTALRTVAEEKTKRETDYNMSQATQLKTLIPEWSNEKSYREDKQNIRSMLVEYGFSEADIQSVRDAKSIKLINDFAKMKLSISNAKPVQKKETSRVLKTGSLRLAAKKGKDETTKLVQRAKNTRDKRVKAAAVSELLNNI